MTITVDGKTLEVGDTAIFRCGGKAVVTRIYEVKPYAWISISFGGIPEDSYDKTYYHNDGHYHMDKTEDIFDIIDIIKASKPEIKEINVVILPETTFFADASRDAADYYGALGMVKIKADITNHKLISAEVVE